MRRLLTTAVIGLCLVLVPALAMAQQATVLGQVLDPDGEALPGVTVTITNQETGYQTVVTTGANGRYRVPGLTPGVYTIEISLQGFRTFTQEDLRLRISQEAQLDWNMQLSSVEETVTVTAETPLIETTKAEVATNISGEQIENLPVKTRRWIDLATLTPGASQDNIRGFYYNNVNLGGGTQYYANGFNVDGVNNTWAEMGEPRQNFPADSIAEFSVKTQQFKAEDGLATGGVLETVTKSGTNQFHGTFYEYFRDDSLNAIGVFENEKPQYKRHQFGGNLGGPIVENQTHFFASVERTDETEFYTVNTFGAFPSEEGTFPRDNFRNMYVVKGDHQWDPNNHTFVRYAREREYRPNLFAGGSNAASRGFGFAVPRDSIVIGHNWVISDRSFFEIRFQEAYSKYIVSPHSSGVGGGHNFDPGDFGPERAADCITPAINRPSISTGGCNSQMGPERRWQIKPEFSYYQPEWNGSHDLKIGLDYNYIEFAADSCCTYPDEFTFNFDTDAPFDPNDPSTHPFLFTSSIGVGFFDDVPVQHISWYVQDDWQPTDTLTLNLGLRYDAQPGAFNEDIDELTFPIDVPYHDASQRGDWNNFGPRFGFAYDPLADGTTVIRGGWGIYYQNIQTLQQFGERTWPNSQSIFIVDPDFLDPLGGRSPEEFASTAPPNIDVLANDFQNPMAHQISVGFSRVLAPRWALSADVSYTRGDSERINRDVNYFISPTDFTRPNPNFGRVVEDRTEGETRYKALMLKLERRFADGFQLLANYTLASVEDNLSTPGNQFQEELEYGPAEADRRHRLTLSGMYMLPYEIQVSGIWQWSSSLPVDLNSGTDLNGDGRGGDYPAGFSRNLGCRDATLQDINGYRSSLGLSAIAAFECPSNGSIDLRVSKFFDVYGPVRLELMGQAFNLLNTAYFYPSTGNMRSSNLGRPTEAYPTRQVELAAKITF